MQAKKAKPATPLPSVTPTKQTPANKTPAKGAASGPATPGTGVGWTPKEEEALKKAAAQFGPETPNRWENVAKKVGGGKTAQSCKKHLKDMK